MIGQNVYSRSSYLNRYVKSQGLGSVGYSASVNDSMRNVLARYCEYDANALTVCGEKDYKPDRYLKLPISANSSSFILSRTSYIVQSENGRSSRSTFISHQYVVDPDSAQWLLWQPGRMLGAAYLSEDINGQDLAYQEYDYNSFPAQSKRFDPIIGSRELMESGIDQNKFYSIMLAVADCLENGRRIYFVVDQDLTDSWSYAARILFYIFSCLPIEMRHALTYSTLMAKDPRNNQFTAMINFVYAAYVEQPISQATKYVNVMGRMIANEYLFINNDLYFIGDQAKDDTRITESYYLQAATSLLYSAGNSIEQLQQFIDRIQKAIGSRPWRASPSLFVYDISIVNDKQQITYAFFAKNYPRLIMMESQSDYLKNQNIFGKILDWLKINNQLNNHPDTIRMLFHIVQLDQAKMSEIMPILSEMIDDEIHEGKRAADIFRKYDGCRMDYSIWQNFWPQIFRLTDFFDLGSDYLDYQISGAAEYRLVMPLINQCFDELSGILKSNDAHRGFPEQNSEESFRLHNRSEQFNRGARMVMQRVTERKVIDAKMYDDFMNYASVINISFFGTESGRQILAECHRSIICALDFRVIPGQWLKNKYREPAASDFAIDDQEARYRTVLLGVLKTQLQAESAADFANLDLAIQNHLSRIPDAQRTSVLEYRNQYVLQEFGRHNWAADEADRTWQDLQNRHLLSLLRPLNRIPHSDTTIIYQWPVLLSSKFLKDQFDRILQLAGWMLNQDEYYNIADNMIVDLLVTIDGKAFIPEKDRVKLHKLIKKNNVKNRLEESMNYIKSKSLEQSEARQNDPMNQAPVPTGAASGNPVSHNTAFNFRPQTNNRRDYYDNTRFGPSTASGDSSLYAEVASGRSIWRYIRILLVVIGVLLVVLLLVLFIYWLVKGGWQITRNSLNDIISWLRAALK